MDNYNPVRNKIDELALAKGYYWDPVGSDRVIRFITTFCKLSKGIWAGKPIELIPWQIELIRQLYSWYRPDGTRRFRTGLVLLPKKQGKSSLISALGIYHLMADQEAGSEVVCAARNRAQASIVYNEAKNMLKASPALQKHLKPIDYQKRITYESTNSVLKALSADIESHDGINASFSICDELHLWLGGKSKLWNVLRYAGAARRQPLILAITTAGRERHSVCYEQYKYSKKVADATIEAYDHFSLIYEADEKDDWQDPETWKKANPSLGYTVKLEDMASDAARALKDPGAKDDFLQLRLNLWLSKDQVWLRPEAWDACNGPASIPKGSDVYLGVDLSAVSDITAVVMVAKIGEKYHIIPRMWIPEDEAHLRNSKDGIQYRSWEEQGLIEFIPGAVIDYDYVFRFIMECHDDYNVVKLCLDRKFAGQLYVDLVNAGFSEDKMAKINQGIGMSPWIKEFERLVAQKKLCHGGHKVLAWMCSNTVAQSDSNGDKKLLKPSPHSPEKIDGIVAAVMALAGAISCQSEEAPVELKWL